jgi:hypothetical protein
MDEIAKNILKKIGFVKFWMKILIENIMDESMEM